MIIKSYLGDKKPLMFSMHNTWKNYEIIYIWTNASAYDESVIAVYSLKIYFIYKSNIDR